MISEQMINLGIPIPQSGEPVGLHKPRVHLWGCPNTLRFCQSGNGNEMWSVEFLGHCFESGPVWY